MRPRSARVWLVAVVLVLAGGRLVDAQTDPLPSILAFGNSDGDQQMLEWTAAGEGARFMGIVRHTDGEREWAYDRQSSIGRLDKALDEAQAKGWTVVDMKQDWKVIYPFQK